MHRVAGSVGYDAQHLLGVQLGDALGQGPRAPARLMATDAEICACAPSDKGDKAAKTVMLIAARRLMGM
ncbi:MAG: hypothetical protein HC801_11825 [Nitrospira sp.]|nr:hypothetical protein [Nitrospira sp.]